MHITLFMSAQVRMSSSGRQRLNLSVKLWGPPPQAWLVFIERCYFSFCPSLAMLKAFWLQLLWRCCYPLDTCSGCFSQRLSKRSLVISGEALFLIWGGASSQIPNESSLRPLPTSLHTHHPRWPSQSQTPSASLILTHTVWFSWVCLCPSAATMKRRKSVFVFFLSVEVIGDMLKVLIQARFAPFWTELNRECLFKFQLSLKYQMGNKNIQHS